jgi:hypothetical protein
MLGLKLLCRLFVMLAAASVVPGLVHAKNAPVAMTLPQPAEPWADGFGWPLLCRNGLLVKAGNDPKVSALVYVAARAPDAGEDFGALASNSRSRPRAPE